MAPPVDRDWLTLDSIIALADDVYRLAGQTKQVSDDPDVLLRQVDIEAAALRIEKLARDYRRRLRELKQIEESVEREAGIGVLGTEKERGERGGVRSPNKKRDWDAVR